MAATPSQMIELGTVAPAFSLPDTVSGKTVSLDDYTGSKGYLVAFLCNHCPYVIHVRDELARLGRDLQGQGLAVVAISANDAQKYPDDAPDKMKAEAEQNGYTFPYLFDESQEVAKAYQAACTPDFYLFDADRKLVYRGQLDASRPGNPTPVTGEDIRRATEALLAGDPPIANQVPSIGCNIKWKPGNNPDYFG